MTRLFGVDLSLLRRWDHPGKRELQAALWRHLDPSMVEICDFQDLGESDTGEAKLHKCALMALYH